MLQCPALSSPFSSLISQVFLFCHVVRTAFPGRCYLAHCMSRSGLALRLRPSSYPLRDLHHSTSASGVNKQSGLPYLSLPLFLNFAYVSFVPEAHFAPDFRLNDQSLYNTIAISGSNIHSHPGFVSSHSFDQSGLLKLNFFV